MNTTAEPRLDRMDSMASPAKKPTQDKPLLSDTPVASQNDLNLVREILVGPSEEINEERIVEVIRMIEAQDESLTKRMARLEAQMKKLAAAVDSNQVHTVSEIGGTLVSVGQKIMDMQDKLQPVAAITKS